MHNYKNLPLLSCGNCVVVCRETERQTTPSPLYLTWQQRRWRRLHFLWKDCWPPYRLSWKRRREWPRSRAGNFRNL